MKDYCDIVTRIVPHYGVLPIVIVDGVEVFRGSFYPTSQKAFDAAYAVALKEGYIK
jgi:hypothetical protein